MTRNRHELQSQHAEVASRLYTVDSLRKDIFEQINNAKHKDVPLYWSLEEFVQACSDAGASNTVSIDLSEYFIELLATVFQSYGLKRGDDFAVGDNLTTRKKELIIDSSSYEAVKPAIRDLVTLRQEIQELDVKAYLATGTNTSTAQQEAPVAVKPESQPQKLEAKSAAPERTQAPVSQEPEQAVIPQYSRDQLRKLRTELGNFLENTLPLITEYSTIAVASSPFYDLLLESMKLSTEQVEQLPELAAATTAEEVIGAAMVLFRATLRVRASKKTADILISLQKGVTYSEAQQGLSAIPDDLTELTNSIDLTRNGNTVDIDAKQEKVSTHRKHEVFKVDQVFKVTDQDVIKLVREIRLANNPNGHEYYGDQYLYIPFDDSRTPIPYMAIGLALHTTALSQPAELRAFDISVTEQSMTFWVGH